MSERAFLDTSFLTYSYDARRLARARAGSENMQDGRTIDALAVRDPFAITDV